MSDDVGAFAPPPFEPEDALLRMQRDLRSMGLLERAGRFERRSVVIARVALAAGGLEFSIVRRPSRNSPEWQSRTLTNSAAVRDACAEVKKKLAAWNDTDD